MLKALFHSRFKGKLRVVCFYMVCCFLLLLPALYNSYPLATPDTGAYISNGFNFHIPVDRPITYSVFILLSSLGGFTLWTVVISQTLILIYFLRRITIKLLDKHYTNRIFVLIILLISVFTSAGWYCSHLIPDIFTAILILTVADYYLSALSKKGKVIYFLLIVFFILQHNSNLVVVIIFCLLARIYTLIKGRSWFSRKTALVWIAALSSFIALSFFNLWEGNSFRPSAGTHVFLMARMAENGILDQFLAEYCPTENYSICKYQNNTGDRQWNFMWGENTDLQEAGSWDKREEEYHKIIVRSLYRPKYLGLQIYEALEAGVRQLPLMQLSSIIQGKGSSTYNSIEYYFPREIKEYRTALQQTGALNNTLGFFNALIFLFTILTGIATLWLYKKNAHLNLFFFLIISVTFICINAFVTAALSTVMDRLQSRVFWLIPYACILYLFKCIPLERIPGFSQREELSH